jgi:hypothetical protein
VAARTQATAATLTANAVAWDADAALRHTETARKQFSGRGAK